ncbi:MAG: MMPL family transporter [Chitinophagales bacterium]|nr:MMPL family transporter [Chitinophagaceae bacterium]MCB9063932.1 MMPL family transporter [Chitinophagales bacterium]
MWHKVAVFIIKFRVALLVLLLAATAFMGYKAQDVHLSYKYGDAIPRDNPKYLEYQKFREKFGEDGNLMVVGIQTDKFFEKEFFEQYAQLAKDLAQIDAVENVLSVPTAINIVKDTVSGKLNTVNLIDQVGTSDMDSFKTAFFNLPFYRGLLYNKGTNSYLMGLSIDKEVLNSKKRDKVNEEIVALVDKFAADNDVQVYKSGLPYIRASVMKMIKDEMRLFLILSFLLTATILALFFRSFMAVVTSMIIVAIGVIWSLGTMALLGYEITVLTGLIPSLVVVIGIPNCIYFLNKYHTEFNKSRNKPKALLRMVDKMGIVTLFTNMTTAIGFGVFAFTESALLKSFGIVAALNIVALFIISLIFIPALYSFLPAPKGRHVNYLQNKFVNKILTFFTDWVFSHRPWIYVASAAVVAGSVWGMYRLQSVGYIVDDLPEDNSVYTDMKFFEQNFNGVMPLEIVVDARKRNAVTTLGTMQKIDRLNREMKQYPDVGSSLSYIEAVKFARQAYYMGDSSSFGVPNMFDAAFIQPYLRMKGANEGEEGNMFSKVVSSFVDSNKQEARISFNIKDIGTKRLPPLLDSIRPKVAEIFDSSRYDVTFTGVSVIYLEGSKFIIKSLRNSILLAFVMIFGCMVVLFRSWRILLISIVINIIPLIITAGIMGWSGIVIKPSTVLVFSVALGITVDVTIRFLVNFRQELERNDDDIASTVHKTIHDTGLSIIYTSLILIAGFGVFILSKFDGTKSLGLLTSMTLFIAMITNLILQPALLLWMDKILKKSKSPKWFINEDDEEQETQA